MKSITFVMLLVVSTLLIGLYAIADTSANVTCQVAIAGSRYFPPNPLPNRRQLSRQRRHRTLSGLQSQ